VETDFTLFRFGSTSKIATAIATQPPVMARIRCPIRLFSAAFGPTTIFLIIVKPQCDTKEPFLQPYFPQRLKLLGFLP
jgi:hypothetical protein